MLEDQATLPEGTGSRETLGQRIRTLRRYAGMTQADLATAMGISRSAVAHWETDRDGRLREHLPKLAEMLNVPVEVFLNGMASQPTSIELSIDEVDLLKIYRELDVTERLSIQRTAARLLKRRSTGG